MRLKLDWTLGKDIVKLAYPVTIAMLTQTAINLVDTIMVGRLEPEYSIAGQSAIAISLILFWAVGGMISSIGVGTQALSARRFGEGGRKKAGQVLNNAAFLGAVLSVIATVAVIIALPYLFPYLHSNPSVVEFGVDYCGYRFLGVGSMVLTIVFKGFFDGIGQTKVHMVAAITMNLVNIVLNYALIFGVGPFPQMYVAGAGLASLIATYVGLFVMVIASARPSTRRAYGLYDPRSFCRRISWDVVRIGIPGGVATMVVMVGFGVFMMFVGWLDMGELQAATYKVPEYAELQLGAFAQDPRIIWNAGLHDSVLGANPPVLTSATKVIMDIMSIVFMTCMAWGQATATLVGQSLGAGNPDLAERYGWESVRQGAYFMGALGLVIMAFPDSVTALFNPDAHVIAAAHDPLRLVACSAALMGTGMILAQALFGAGMTMFVAAAELVLHFFCMVPCAYLFGVSLDGGLLGIWSAVVTYVAMLAAVMAWKFHHGDWKRNVI